MEVGVEFTQQGKEGKKWYQSDNNDIVSIYAAWSS